MSSLGDLYFALGLDDKEFNNALDAAKKRVAELGADIHIGVKLDSDNIAKQLQATIGADRTIKIKADISSVEETIARTKAELEDLKKNSSWNTSGITGKEGFIKQQESLLERFKNELKIAEEASKPIQVKIETDQASIALVKEQLSKLETPIKTKLTLEYDMDKFQGATTMLKNYTDRLNELGKIRLGIDDSFLRTGVGSNYEKGLNGWLSKVSDYLLGDSAGEAGKSLKTIQKILDNHTFRITAEVDPASLIASAKKANVKVPVGVDVDLVALQKKLKALKIPLDFNVKQAINDVKTELKKAEFEANLKLNINKKDIEDAIKATVSGSESGVTLSEALGLSGGKSSKSKSNKKIKKTKKDMDELGKSTQEASNWASQLGNQFNNLVSIYSIERFIRNLYTVGGEFQKQQIALQNMIGDADKANAIFERIKTLSVKSPFSFSELASYTKQLSAYGVEYDELYDTTKRLADISAGVGVDMSRLILAYGQVRSAEVLRGQELRQFTEAGIPMVAELAKRLEVVRGRAVSVGEVFEAISKRQVSFDMVKDVLFDMTDPGGKFFESQERLAESLAGKWVNLKDAWDIMIAHIANDKNTVLAGLADVMHDILSSFKTWLPFISGAVIGLGTLRGAMTLFNAVAKANPWIALGTVLAGIVSHVYTYYTEVNTLAGAIENINAQAESTIQQSKEAEQTSKRYLSTLKETAKNESERELLLRKQKIAFEQLKEEYPDLLRYMSLEKLTLEDINRLESQIEAREQNKQVKALETKYDQLFKESEKRKRIYDELKDRYQKKQNGEYTGLDYLFSLFLDEEDVTNALNDYTDAQSKATIAYNEWVNALNSNNPSGGEGNIRLPWQLKADAIIDKYPSLTELRKPKDEEDIYEYFDALSVIFKSAKEKFDQTASKELQKPNKDLMDAANEVNLAIGGRSFYYKEEKKSANAAGKLAAEAYINALKERLKELTSKWSVYKEVFDATGNRQMALNLSELGNIGFKDELEHLRSEMTKELSLLNVNLSAGDVFNMSMDELNKKIGDKDKLKRIQAIYDTYHNANRALRKETINDFIEIIRASRDFEAQISEIERKLQENLLKLREGAKKADLSTDSEEYKRAESQLRKEAEKKKTEVRFEEFKESSNWVKVFDDLDRVSNATLDDMIAKIEAFAGSAEDSQKELKELVEALSKLRKESIERNPFGGLANSISRLKELQLAQQRGLNRNGKYMVRDSTGFHREMDASDLSNAIKAAEADLVASINGISGAFKDLEGIVNPLIKVLDSFGEGADDLVMGFSILSDILSTASSTSNSFSNLMGLSVGKDDKGNAISLADKLGIKNAGLWGAVAGAALGAISSITGAHDKKLDKAIEKSKQKVKELENAYKNIEDAISTQLGEATRSQTESMVKNLEQQRSELYKQLEAEEDKKKTDNSKVSDYKQQIHKVEREMALFYKNLASEQYGIDLKGWSSQIAKSLTDAFAKGEDAAIAFKRTTSEILSSLVTEMINLNVIQKALKGVEDYLFGANGIATNNSEGGAKITKNEAIGLSNKMQEVEGSLTEAKYIWDALNEATGGALETVEDVAKGGLTKDIQGVTEDTANLLGSYLNAIRQSVHVKQQLLEQLVGSDVPKMNYLAEAQLQQLQMVVANTKRNADTADKIYSLIDRVVDKGGNRLKI